MSDATFTRKARAFARKNTSLQSKFGRDSEVLYLLKRVNQKGAFVSITQLTTGFYVEPGALREDISLFYSTTSDVSSSWKLATHIGFGIPDADDAIFVYEIQPDQKEATTPNVLSSEWKCFASRLKQERFTIP